MYHSLLKWMFARSFLKNIRWMFAMNNTSLNLLRRMLWRMLRRMLRRMLWKSSLNVCWRCDEECCDNVVISLLKICHLIMMKYSLKYAMKMWWSIRWSIQWMIYNQLAYCECLCWSIDKEMYHSLLKWMFARSFLKNIRWMFVMNNTSLNLLRRMLWRMLCKSSLKMWWRNVEKWSCEEFVEMCSWSCCDEMKLW